MTKTSSICLQSVEPWWGHLQPNVKWMTIKTILQWDNECEKSKFEINSSHWYSWSNIVEIKISKNLLWYNVPMKNSILNDFISWSFISSHCVMVFFYLFHIWLRMDVYGSETCTSWLWTIVCSVTQIFVIHSLNKCPLSTMGMSQWIQWLSFILFQSNIKYFIQV